MNSMSQLPNEPIAQLPNDRGHAERSAPSATLDEPKSPARLLWRALLIVVGLFAFSGLLAFSTASPAVMTFLGSSCAASPARSCTTTSSQVWHAGYDVWHAGYWQWHDGYQQCYPGYWQWHSGHQQCYSGHWETHWVCDDGYGCWQENNWVDGYCDWISGYNEWHDSYCDWISGYNEWVSGYWEQVSGYFETVYTEVCDTNPTCTGTCPTGQDLKCNGTAAGGGCGPGANCWCEVNNQFAGGTCNSASDCAGQSFNCPYSQLGGATWSCQSHQCVSICGDGSNGNPTSAPPTSAPQATSTPVPTSTPIPTPTPTRTPFPIPTPIVVPSCPAHPEDYGGSVTSVVPPGAPSVQFASAPTYPVVVGQDAVKRGADLTAQISVGACAINWHYRVKEDYVWCGKETCDCTKDSCELRQRWKEWDDTCTEDYPLAGVTIDGKLSQDSVNSINGPLQQKYPGVKVYQGALRFFPSPLAAQTQYSIGNPTMWGMAGQKYPLQDPGGWDITVNVVTQPTIHCGPLQWSLPFPKQITTYFRDQTLTK